MQKLRNLIFSNGKFSIWKLIVLIVFAIAVIIFIVPDWKTYRRFRIERVIDKENDRFNFLIVNRGSSIENYHLWLKVRGTKTWFGEAEFLGENGWPHPTPEKRLIVESKPKKKGWLRYDQVKYKLPKDGTITTYYEGFQGQIRDPEEAEFRCEDFLLSPRAMEAIEFLPYFGWYQWGFVILSLFLGLKPIFDLCF